MNKEEVTETIIVSDYENCIDDFYQDVKNLGGIVKNVEETMLWKGKIFLGYYDVKAIVGDTVIYLHKYHTDDKNAKPNSIEIVGIKY